MSRSSSCHNYHHHVQVLLSHLCFRNSDWRYHYHGLSFSYQFIWISASLSFPSWICQGNNRFIAPVIKGFDKKRLPPTNWSSHYYWPQNLGLIEKSNWLFSWSLALINMINTMTVINGILVTIFVCITILSKKHHHHGHGHHQPHGQPDHHGHHGHRDKIIDQEPQVRVAGLRALGSICCVLEGIRSSICLSKKRDNEAWWWKCDFQEEEEMIKMWWSRSSYRQFREARGALLVVEVFSCQFWTLMLSTSTIGI